MIYNKYTYDQLVNICQLIDSGVDTRKDISEKLRIPYSTVCRLFRAFVNNNYVLPPRKVGPPRATKLSNAEKQMIKTWVDEDCTRTLRELAAAFRLQTGVRISHETVRRLIDTWKYSIKRVTIRSEAAETEELWALRNEFSAWWLSSEFQNGKVICLDESGFKLSMRRSRGRSRRGNQARLVIPRKKTKNISVMAAISYNQIVHYKILDGKGNEERFLGFLNELLDNLPTTGYTLVMDNVRFHHAESVKALVQSRQHQIKYLPAYSPFFNPIENMFSQWKQFVKASAPENEQDLVYAMNEVRTVVREEHLRNYFNHVNNNCVRCLRNDRAFF